MKKTCFTISSLGILFLAFTWIPAVVQAQDTVKVSLSDLSAFDNPPESWSITGGVTTLPDKADKINIVRGSGVLVNHPRGQHSGKDLFTNFKHGDMDLELEYLVPAGSNSGIYLQGRYEIQLRDSWTVKNPTSADNGGVYERWDDSRPEGQKGFQGHAPRQNASRAPGLWQHLKVSFQAPRFDADGNKIAHARLQKVELNGVVIHEDVLLMGPTRGSVGEGEVAQGPLRFQGDHGAVAFRNIKVIRYEHSGDSTAVDTDSRRYVVNPILVSARDRSLLRSFRDLPNGDRLSHAISVGSLENVHYTYDMNRGNLVQVWRGKFLDATPMWHSRGDGSSRPNGSVENLLQNPSPVLNKLNNRRSAWKNDTTGTGFRSMGYELLTGNIPVFKYRIYDAVISDKIQVADGGTGVERTLELENVSDGLFVRLATGKSIERLKENLFLVDDQSYYLRIDDSNGAEPFIRSQGKRQELLIPAQDRVRYTILF